MPLYSRRQPHMVQFCLMAGFVRHGPRWASMPSCRGFPRPLAGGCAAPDRGRDLAPSPEARRRSERARPARVRGAVRGSLQAPAPCGAPRRPTRRRSWSPNSARPSPSPRSGWRPSRGPTTPATWRIGSICCGPTGGPCSPRPAKRRPRPTGCWPQQRTARPRCGTPHGRRTHQHLSR